MFINKVITTIEYVIHIVISIFVLYLLGLQIYFSIINQVQIQDILLMFIYLEVLTMVGIYFNSGKIPIRYPLYISMFALSRHITLYDFGNGYSDLLYLSGSILLISISLLSLKYGYKITDTHQPELEWDEIFLQIRLPYHPDDTTIGT